MTYIIPEKFFKYLSRWERFRYYNADLKHHEKITGWKLWSEKPDIWFKYSFPTITEINEFEKLQGWDFPESLRAFLISIGRRTGKDNFRFFFKMEDGRELKIATFFGLIEMLPIFFGEFGWTRICSANSGDIITINPQGQIGFRFRMEHTIIAQSFEEFLERLEVRKVED